jgi:4-aminobutyrate--pyruvate transaminase
VERAAEKGAYLQQRLQDLRSHEIVGDVRGLGLMGGVELVRDRATKESFDPALGSARRVCLSALEEGVIFRPLAGDVVAISPPFVISDKQIDQMVMVLGKAIARVEQELTAGV